MDGRADTCVWKPSGGLSEDFLNVADIEFIQNFHKMFMERKRLTACYHFMYINIPNVSN